MIKQKQGEFFTRVNLYACHQKVQNSYPHTFFSRDDEQLFMLSTAGVANDNILYARLQRAYDSQFFILFQQHHFNSLVSHPVDLLLIDLRTEMWERPFCVLDGCSTNKSAKRRWEIFLQTSDEMSFICLTNTTRWVGKMTWWLDMHTHSKAEVVSDMTRQRKEGRLEGHKIYLFVDLAAMTKKVSFHSLSPSAPSPRGQKWWHSSFECYPTTSLNIVPSHDINDMKYSRSSFSYGIYFITAAVSAPFLLIKFFLTQQGFFNNFHTILLNCSVGELHSPKWQ